jgi:hypothetical protein
VAIVTTALCVLCPMCCTTKHGLATKFLSLNHKTTKNISILTKIVYLPKSLFSPGVTYWLH